MPIFFCIYWSGKELRAYIPKEGNLWNTDTKSAYGDNPESDLKNLRKRFGKNLTEEDLEDFSLVPEQAEYLIIGDLMKHIKLKEAND